jgi:hypothetical protein
VEIDPDDLETVGIGQPEDHPGWGYRDCAPFALDFADGIPRPFRYLSTRLLKEQYQQFTASERAAYDVTKIDTRFPLLGITAEKREDPDNPFWLAKVVARIHRRNAARIEACEAGQHTIFRMHARFGELRLFEQRAHVAWFTGLAGHGTPSLVALCGSLGNFLGYCPSEGTFAGWYPSSAEGLDEFLLEAAGAESREESSTWVDRVSARAGMVHGLFCGRHSPEFASAGQIDVLAKVHEVLTPATVDAGWPSSEYGRIVLAAPLIVTDAPVKTLRQPYTDSLRLRLGQLIAGRTFPRD